MNKRENGDAREAQLELVENSGSGNDATPMGNNEPVDTDELEYSYGIKAVVAAQSTVSGRVNGETDYQSGYIQPPGVRRVEKADASNRVYVESESERNGKRSEK